MGKNKIKETEAIAYIAELGDTLTEAESSFVKAIFYMVKDQYSRDQYLDIIQTCCETLLDCKEEGLSNIELFDKMREKVDLSKKKDDKVIDLKRISLRKADKESDSTSAVQATAELKNLLNLFNMEPIDKVKNDIFLKKLAGADSAKIAALYHKTVKDVEAIYEERLAMVNEIRVKDGKVFIGEDENYSKKLNEQLDDIKAVIF